MTIRPRRCIFAPMTKLLTGLAFLFVLSPLACSGEKEEPPNPLATRSGFCKSWAEGACPKAVVDACNASAVDDCVGTQSDFCLGILPENYDSKHAKTCLAAVKAAYRDANLTAEEIQVVLKLAAPCDQLSKGSTTAGDTCTDNAECNTVSGYACVVKLGATEGTCQIPEEVDPGQTCDGPSQVCGEGNYCNADNCVAYKGTGRPCDGDFQCAPEDSCIISVEGAPGECTARAELNDPCASDADCQSQYCVIEAGKTLGECASMIRLSRSEPLCDTLQ